MSYLIFLVLFDLHYDDHLTATGLTSIQVPCQAATAAASSPPAPDPAPGDVFVVIVEGQRSLGLPFVLQTKQSGRQEGRNGNGRPWRQQAINQLAA